MQVMATCVLTVKKKSRQLFRRWRNDRIVSIRKCQANPGLRVLYNGAGHRIGHDETGGGLIVFKEFTDNLQGAPTGQVVNGLRIIGHGQDELALPCISHTHQLH